MTPEQKERPKNSCFIFHKWLRWSEPETVELTQTHQSLGSVKVLLEKPLVYNEKKQRRFCIQCGIVQERTV